MPCCPALLLFMACPSVSCQSAPQAIFWTSACSSKLYIAVWSSCSMFIRPAISWFRGVPATRFQIAPVACFWIPAESAYVRIAYKPEKSALIEED